MNLTGNWRIPTEILAGAGRISEIYGRARDLGIKRVLLVTDQGVAGLDFFPGILAGFEKVGIEMKKVVPHKKGAATKATPEASSDSSSEAAK